jgi:hypothetical protein
VTGAGVLGRLVLIAVVLAATAAGAAERCEPPADFVPRGRLTANDVVLLFRTMPAAIEIGRHFSVEAIVCAPGAVPRLRIDALMPEHKHGMNYRPTIKGPDHGRWVAEGLMFHMPGRWQLLFDVDRGDRTDRLVTDVLLE